MTKFTPFVVASLLGSTMLAGPALAQETHPETGEPLAADQTFTYTEIDDFPSIDPQKVEDVAGSQVARDLFEGLLNQDEEGNPVPGVATEWSANEDNTVWSFTLRDDATWSNGDPVTAGDFVYAWQRAVDPETASPYAWYMELMAIENAAEIIAGEADPETLGVTALDDLTLEVRLTKELPYFEQMVTHATTFPAHRATIEEHGDAWTQAGNMVSNGAYTLAEYTPGVQLVKVKNPDYWDADNVMIERSATLIINDENQALTRYMADELDWTRVPAGQFPRLSEEMPDQVHSVPELCSYYYIFNQSESGPEAFKDQRVREALSLALDRDIVVNNITAGGQVAAYNFTPGATAGFDIPEIEMASMDQSERDERAKQLMQEAGYGPDNPLSFELIFNTSEAHNKIAVAASQMWKQKLGVEVTLANQEWKTYVETRGNQDFELARAAWCGDYNEASTFLDLLTSDSQYNDGKYSNPEIDQLMDQALTAEDPGEIYQQIEQIAASDSAIIPIYHYANAFLLDPTVKGWPFENVQQTWYSKDLYRVAE